MPLSQTGAPAAPKMSWRWRRSCWRRSSPRWPPLPSPARPPSPLLAGGGGGGGSGRPGLCPLLVSVCGVHAVTVHGARVAEAVVDASAAATAVTPALLLSAVRASHRV
eukprot:TRINITY_DN8163_c0_g1_i1.p3 TRINITY_DN8163_c0_g1~~TRINITY_DN8163_c0_g1_i1.p3  ORF type:complete len:108 (-),score=10.84 TRINITY_DN8163_c0_g1_i1:332-655(-)